MKTLFSKENLHIKPNLGMFSKLSTLLKWYKHPESEKLKYDIEISVG